MVRQIKKRDGSIELFDQAKISSAIWRAGRAVGNGDDLLSDELASVVALFLDKTWGEGVPSVEDIRDIVERVLMETGHVDAARVFILHGERRRQVEALSDGGAGLSGGGLDGDVLDGGPDVSLPASLGPETADPESGNLDLRFSRIRELIDSDAGGRTPDDVSRQMAGSVFTRFALEEIFGPDEAADHGEGAARHEGLGLPSGYLEAMVDPLRLPAPYGSPDAPAAYLASVLRFTERFAAGSVGVDLTDLSLARVCLAGADPDAWAREAILALARGPAGIPSDEKAPVIRIARSPSLAGAKIMESAACNNGPGRELPDRIAASFVRAHVELSRELSLPVLQCDLHARDLPAEDLLERVVVMETSGRLRLSACGSGAGSLAAVEPLISGAQVDAEKIQVRAGSAFGTAFFEELKNVLVRAAAAFSAKNGYLTRLLRGGRGPKAALRRYLGGDGSVVGPGSFRIVHRNLGLAAERAAAEGGGVGKETFAREVIGFTGSVLAEEERRLGLRIRHDPPWASSATRSPSATGPAAAAQASNSERGDELVRAFETSPGAAAALTLAWGRFTGWDPLPGFFVGDASSRMEYLLAVLKGRSEMDHASEIA